MVPQPIDQDRCFYLAPWSREVETLVLRKIADARQLGKWVNGDHEYNERVLARIQTRLSRAPWHLNISWDQYTKKILEWEGRYFEFSYLIKEGGVQYCEVTNKVTASDWTWERLIQVHKKYRRYIVEGELNYRLLQRLFSEEEINSASNSPHNITNNFGSSSSFEEVTSRFMGFDATQPIQKSSDDVPVSSYGSYDGAASHYGSDDTSASGYGSYYGGSNERSGS